MLRDNRRKYNYVNISRLMTKKILIIFNWPFLSYKLPKLQKNVKLLGLINFY